MQVKKIYELDEDLQVVAATPLGPPTEPIFFSKDSFFRAYMSRSHDDSSPSIDFFVNSGGEECIQYNEFSNGASSAAMERFYGHVRTKPVVDDLSKRWPSIRIEWGGPGHKVDSLSRAELVVYFDGKLEFSFLTQAGARGMTYDQAFKNFDYLKRLFRKAQKKRPSG